MGQRICSIEDCAHPVHGRGWCSKHWQRWSKHGSPYVRLSSSKKAPCVIPECDREDTGSCHYADCGRPPHKRALCTGHYNQWLKKKPLKPLRKLNPAGQGRPPCAFPECRNKSMSRGLCSPHSKQRDAGIPLRKLQPRKPGGVYSALVRNDAGEKRCTACQKWLSESEFFKSKGERDGLAGSCKLCISRDARARSLSQYGLTLGDYDALLAAQGGVCAVCEKECSRGTNLSVDHDHDCCPGTKSCGKCVRGLLCRSCNVAIGNLLDDPNLLRAAASYLEARLT